MYIRARFYVCCIDLKVSFGYSFPDQYETVWPLENSHWYAGLINFNILSMSHHGVGKKVCQRISLCSSVLLHICNIIF